MGYSLLVDLLILQVGDSSIPCVSLWALVYRVEIDIRFEIIIVSRCPLLDVCLITGLHLYYLKWK